jgi:hypothetical protein
VPFYASSHIHPGDQLRHSLRCIEWRCCLEYHSDHYAFGVEGTHIVAKGLLLAAMTFIFVAVLEQIAMKLLNAVFGNWDV